MTITIDQAATDYLREVFMSETGEKCSMCGAHLIKCTCGWLGCECEPEAMEAQCDGNRFSCPWCGTKSFKVD